MEILKYEVLGKVVEVPIVRKNIQNAYLRIKDNQIIMTANKWMSLKELEKFGSFHIEKIVMRMNEPDSYEYMYGKNQFVWLFGKKLKITYDQLNSIPEVITHNDNEIIINEFAREEESRVLVNYLKELLHKYVSGSIRMWEGAMGMPTHNFEISNAMTYYGINYSHRLLIKFSYVLAHYSKETIDAVVVHELAHTWESNHSERFWKIVNGVIPEYKIIRKKMRATMCNLMPKEISESALKKLMQNLTSEQ